MRPCNDLSRILEVAGGTQRGSSEHRPGRPAGSRGRRCAPPRAQPRSSRSPTVHSAWAWVREVSLVPGQEVGPVSSIHSGRSCSGGDLGTHADDVPGLLPERRGRQILDRGVRDRGGRPRAVPQRIPVQRQSALVRDARTPRRRATRWRRRRPGPATGRPGATLPRSLPSTRAESPGTALGPRLSSRTASCGWFGWK